jgi:fructose-bisphosphate aldolase class I
MSYDHSAPSPLAAVVARLMADGKGLLAIDESLPTADKRFKAENIPQTEEMRRQWRELILTTPSLGEAISGAILYDETIRQKTRDGTAFTEIMRGAGIIIGIKVDKGTVDLPGHAGETMTEGLDGLRERLKDYRGMGAEFAKWRGVITIGPDRPSRACLEANAQALALYAALCQDEGLVPIVEPEVLMDGDHSLERCGEVTAEVLDVVFGRLKTQGVRLEEMLLKPNMVLPGDDHAQALTPEQVADATLACFRRSVPAAVGGIAFLSGGQSGPEATARLDAMHADKDPLPWPLTFSFGRALQEPALHIWHGNAANTEAAQEALLHRARLDSAARRGLYKPAMEQDMVSL